MNANQVVATVLILVAVVPGAVQARPVEKPKRVNVEATLVSGDRIALELRDGRRISGIVGARLTAGFYLDERTASEVFVKYSMVRALLDPDTGAVIGVPARGQPDWRWVKPVLIAAGVVWTLTLLTGGFLPKCFFPGCD